MLAMVSTILAQNGGQYSENNAGKIEYRGNNTFTIVNKQNCQATFKVSYGTMDSTVIIAPKDSVTFTPSVTGTKFKAKALSTCSNDYGWIEYSLTNLPVMWGKTSATYNKNDSSKFTIVFNTVTESNVAYYTILASKDGKSWDNIGTVLPNNDNKSHAYLFNYPNVITKASFGALGIVLCLAFIFGLVYKKNTTLSSLLAIAIGICLIVSACSKSETTFPTSTKNYTGIWVQSTDIDGTVNKSNTVVVINGK